MGCLPSTPLALTTSSKSSQSTGKNVSVRSVSETRSYARPKKLTSKAYNVKRRPPSHWSDMIFLVPHEWLRRELSAMTKSSKALPHSLSPEDSWRVELFATWIIDYLGPCIRTHQEREEKMWFPFVIEKGCHLPEKQFCEEDQDLMLGLTEIEEISKIIVEAKGVECEEHVAKLKTDLVKWKRKMKQHLKNEEMHFSNQRQDMEITEVDSVALFEEVTMVGGMDYLTKELPGVIVSLQDWATLEYLDLFEKDVSPTLWKIQKEVCIPNYNTFYCAMRDAPRLEQKPDLKKIDFHPSIIPLSFQESLST